MVGFASLPPNLNAPIGLMARPIATMKTAATIHCQSPPRCWLMIALPLLVNALASSKSTAAITRKISNGMDPTQSGGCFSQLGV